MLGLAYAVFPNYYNFFPIWEYGMELLAPVSTHGPGNSREILGRCAWDRSSHARLDTRPAPPGCLLFTGAAALCRLRTRKPKQP